MRVNGRCQQGWQDTSFGGSGQARRPIIPHAPTPLTTRLHYRPNTPQILTPTATSRAMTLLPPQYPRTHRTLRRVVRRLDTRPERNS